jgi:hypothetical protein
MNILGFFENWSTVSLVGFVIMLAVYLWYTFAIIYHLLRFGIGIKPKLLAFVFLVGSFVLFLMTVNAYSKVDWPSLLSKIFNPTP